MHEWHQWTGALRGCKHSGCDMQVWRRYRLHKYGVGTMSQPEQVQAVCVWGCCGGHRQKRSLQCPKAKLGKSRPVQV